MVQVMEILEKCEEVMHLGPDSEVDEYAIKEMKKKVKSHLQKQWPHLSDVGFFINGELYHNLLDAMLDVEDMESIEIRFLKPGLNENWDCNRPTKVIKAIKGGFGGVGFFNYDSKAIDKWANAGEIIEKKAMVRVFPVNFYVPRSIATMSKYVMEEPPRPLVPDLWTIESAWGKMRGLGAVPMTIRICVYTQEERFSYDIDVIRGKLLRDFRAEKIPVTRRSVRSPEEYFYFDRIYASEEMPDLTRNIFEAIFESEGMNGSDISHFFKITSDMARNNLKALSNRGLLDSKGQPPFETYMVTGEILKKKADSLS